MQTWCRDYGGWSSLAGVVGFEWLGVKRKLAGHLERNLGLALVDEALDCYWVTVAAAHEWLLLLSMVVVYPSPPYRWETDE